MLLHARSRRVVHTGALMTLCGALTVSAPVVAHAADQWVEAGSTRFSRITASATTLGDGRVLVVGGGFAESPVADVELFDRRDGWSTGAPLRTPRMRHAAVRMVDGRVLVVGGFHAPRPGNASPAESFDPRTGTWTDRGFLRPPRTGPTATVLSDGRVAVFGGLRVSEAPTTMGALELFDPVQDTWTRGEPLSRDRHEHTATILPNGRVLVAGGASRGGAHPDGRGVWNDAWLYWPDRDAWGEAPAMRVARHRHQALGRDDGRVLVTGGASYNREPVADVELFDWRLHAWVEGPPLNIARHSHTSTLLPDGRVLVQGGIDSDGRPVEHAELLDAARTAWTLVEPAAPAAAHARVLSDGSVLLFGGTGLAYLSAAEIFEPDQGTWTFAGSLSTPRRFFASRALPGGGAVVWGGTGITEEEAVPPAERFDPASLRWTTVERVPRESAESEPVPLGTGGVLSVDELPGGGRTFTWTNGRRSRALGTVLAVQGPWTVTALPGGRALVVGGWFQDATGPLPAPRAWVGDAETGVKATGPMVEPRFGHVAVPLRDGRVLIAGGEPDARHRLSSVEVYDPDADAWTSVAPMRTGRSAHAALTLRDGRVLVLGGYGGPARSLRFVPGE